MSHSYSREQAASLLGVSTRTLDRYLKSDKVRSKRIHGRIRIYQPELEKLGELFGKKVITEENIIEKKEKKPKSLDLVKKTSSELSYRNLYEETKQELRETYKELQATSYKLGQAEEQLKSSVPLLEHQSKSLELEEAEETLKKRSHEVEQKLKVEQLNKWIFAGLLFGILALQPILWVLSR